MIGKTIHSILVNDSALIALVPAARIFPYVMNADTVAPCIVYVIDSVEPEYTKGGWVLDTITFSVHSFAKDYATLQSVASAVRTALEYNKTGYGTQNINHIYMIGMEEGYDPQSDIFGNKLQFSVKINTY
jgi:hypothetical protein